MLDIFKEIKGFVFDVDGVFTDGTIQITESGEQWRTMHIRDGYAIKKLSELNIPICIISGGTSEGVRIRFKRLGVHSCFLGIEDKMKVLREWLEEMNLSPDHLCYMGDDLPDLDVMEFIKYSCCPSDADPEIIKRSMYVSPYPGGKGCVRDVVEKYLRIHQLWPVS